MNRQVFQRRARAALAVGVSLLAGATAAQAQYSVQTSANTGRGYNRGCAANYNSNGTGAQFIINDGSNADCIAGGGPGTTSFNGETLTVNGTTDTTGRLTSAQDTSRLVTLDGSGTAFASAAADLATGEVHLYGSGLSSYNDTSAIAQARLSDTLHFTVAGASANTVTYIPVSFSFDGVMPAGSDPTRSFAELNYSFSFGGASAYEFGDYAAGYYGYYGNYPTFVYSGDPRISGWQSAGFSSYSPLDTRFSGVYALTGATADVAIDFLLGFNVTATTLDYSHTGRVGIGNVAGVSYTSDSGVFLTATGTPGAVPEPASWGMMIVGLGAIGGAMRSRPGRVRSLSALGG